MNDQTMDAETTEKLRTGLEWVQCNGAVCHAAHIDDLLALLPEKPKPEPAEGPYTVHQYVQERDGRVPRWFVQDCAGNIIAANIPDAPTAKLLASAHEARELLTGVLNWLEGTNNWASSRHSVASRIRPFVLEHGD